MSQVTIVMGVKNGEKYLANAIESILNQRGVDLELFVMNDGSTDRTGQILQEFAVADSRLHVFEQENRGLGQSLNSLIKSSKSPFIARMDADDISLPWRLHDQIQYLDNNPDVGLVGSWVAFLGADGDIRGCQCFPDSNKWLTGQLQVGRNVIVHSSVMMRRSVLEKLEGPYRFKLVQDYDLWLRISEISKVGMTKRVSVLTRWHAEQVSGKRYAQRRLLHEQIQKLGKMRRSGRMEETTPLEIEAKISATENFGKSFDISEEWYEAMSAVYRRDIGEARRLFAIEGKKQGKLAKKARLWQSVLTIPLASHWLPLFFSPLKYMVNIETAIDSEDLKMLELILRDLRSENESGYAQ